MRHDVLSDALSALKNQKNQGKSEAIVRPTSKVIKSVFEILKKEGYVLDFNITDDKRGGYAVVKLTNQINDICAIRPRFSVTLEEFEKFEKRFLPSKDFGRLILTTSQGVMTHVEAKANKTGGVLLAYVY
ncbi:MAG TPA: 30S ribosomal protein S8 [Candidatus Nanoarchaeia archaeon]|nr:30S ribosomal protein S8 [Candidatus Nanoarchaeia archaeon]